MSSILTKNQINTLCTHAWDTGLCPFGGAGGATFELEGGDTPHQLVEIPANGKVIVLRVYEGGLFEATVRGTGVTLQGKVADMRGVLESLSPSGTLVL